jgi:hypothetical protein
MSHSDPSMRIAPAARKTDPWTSAAADRSVRDAATTQREMIYSAYEQNPAGLTDEEAAAFVKATGCWWKRCSELRQQGRIVDTGKVRVGSAGRPRIVCAIPSASTLF